MGLISRVSSRTYRLIILPKNTNMSPNPAEVNPALSKSDLKFKFDKYELKHLGAITANADMLVVCGDTIDNPAFTKPIALPVHREKIVSLRATHLIEGTGELMNELTKVPISDNSTIDQLILPAGYTHKSVLKYFQSVYDLRNMKSSKIKASSLIRNYFISFHLGDFTSIDEMQPFLEKCILTGQIKAFDVYGLLMVSDRFDDAIINRLIARKSFKIEKSQFNTPMVKSNIILQIKKEMRKSKAPICALTVHRMIKLISKVINKVEPKAIYHLIEVWLNACNNI